MSSSTNDPNRDPKVVFDVRPIPGRVKHQQIFQRWVDLPVSEFFVLLNDHDPIPLRYQFEAEFKDCYSWEYLEQGPEEYRVKITKLKPLGDGPHATPKSCGSGHAHSSKVAAPESTVTETDGIQHIDVRGLEPPEPLVRILDLLESFPEGEKVTVHALTDREPCHLFGEAEQRGFDTDSNEQSDGSWLTVISRG